MKTSIFLKCTAFLLLVTFTSCGKRAGRGVPNNPGSAEKDERTSTPQERSFDGRQQTIIPESR